MNRWLERHTDPASPTAQRVVIVAVGDIFPLAMARFAAHRVSVRLARQHRSPCANEEQMQGSQHPVRAQARGKGADSDVTHFLGFAFMGAAKSEHYIRDESSRLRESQAGGPGVWA